MINIENYKIVDIIESRKDIDVATWLKTFPNFELVSRDGHYVIEMQLMKLIKI